MNRQLIINRIPGEVRIALLENKKLVEFNSIRESIGSSLGNIYRGTVRKVVPGMQSAFIEYGGERTGFLYLKDVQSDISYEEFQETFKDEDEEEQKVKTTRNITDYVKEGQQIIVQVIKEPIGMKGARLTTHINLPGRFCVLMPTIGHVGISKKIQEKEKRHELQELGKRVTDKGYGIIFRTMAGETSPKIVEREIVALMRKWQTIEENFKNRKSDTMLCEPSSPFIETIKNTYTSDLAGIIADSKEDYSTALQYIKTFIPEKADCVTLYELPYPIFDYYGIEAEIEQSLKKKVWLKCGGFLYIEQTEALTVIDVNTGKFLGKDSQEETILKTNLEAVAEIAYHIRLRNLAGIIIVDFIDMRSHHNRKRILHELEKQLEKDPAKNTVYHFTRLGLIQITRKRTAESNIAALMEPCPYCNGNSLIKSRETISFEIIRELRRQTLLYGVKHFRIEAHPDIIFWLESHSDHIFKSIKNELKITVECAGNSSFHQEHFIVSERLRK